MITTPKREIYFSFFMFTADLQPDNPDYTQILINHLTALTKMGYDGFDMHIAPPPEDLDLQTEIDSYLQTEVDSYRRLKEAFDKAGLKGAKFTSNVGTTKIFDPTSSDEKHRDLALSYLKSRVDITWELGGESIMAGPFLYPYGVFPGKWGDAIQEWWQKRWPAAVPIFRDLAAYASTKGVKLAIEPVKNWETAPPNMVSEALNFVDHVRNPRCGVTIDTAQVIMESQGPNKFKNNLARATDQEPDKNRLHYVHISAPDRGAIHDSWIPWAVMLREIEPVYRGPYLIEIFNAIPPFDSSMRMTRRRFWRQAQDDEGPEDYSAYHIARMALRELKEQIASDAGRQLMRAPVTRILSTPRK